jgi:hypothetical protein
MGRWECRGGWTQVCGRGNHSKAAYGALCECPRVTTLGPGKRKVRPLSVCCCRGQPIQTLRCPRRATLRAQGCGGHHEDARQSSWHAGGEGNDAGRTNLLTIS